MRFVGRGRELALLRAEADAARSAGSASSWSAVRPAWARPASRTSSPIARARGSTTHESVAPEFPM